MGISEFAVHNVLRTYNRQERVGRIPRRTSEASQASRSPDQLTLSATARKAQWIGQFAAQVVDGRQPNLPPEQRSEQVRSTTDELIARHGEELRDESVTPEDLDALLRPLYLG
ncbi:MAG: hypothetical protein HZB55_13585 [Deltaproteobacteria bacterium]|nr:hypothetical protein [Deltaproteobacteria bacterium]